MTKKVIKRLTILMVIVLSMSLLVSAADKQYEGEKVVVYTMFSDNAGLQEAIKTFNEKTGAQITAKKAPANYDQWVSTITTYLSSGYQGIDVIYTDDFASVGFVHANWFEPLDYPEEYLEQFPKEVIDNNTFDGKLYMLPQDVQPMLFFVRKDIFAEAGLDYPKTLTEMIELGKKLTVDKDGDGNIDQYGLAMAGTPGYLINEVFRYTKQAGGDVLNFNDPDTQDAIQLMHDLIYKFMIVPKNAVAESYESLNENFKNGKYAMAYQWPYLVGVLEQAGMEAGKDFEVIKAPEYRNGLTISGSWHYAVNAFSKHKEAAKAFVKYLGSKEGQILYLQDTNVQGSNKYVLNDPEVKNKSYAIQCIADYFNSGIVGTRPSETKINEIQEVIEHAVSAYLTKQITLEEVISRVQPRLEELVGQ